MPLIKDLADRLLPPTWRHPEPPVAAEASAPSFVLSVDDDVRPTPRLVRLALDAAEAAAGLSLADLTGEGMPATLDVWPGEPYRFLAGLTRALGPSLAVVLGEATSAEAKVLSAHAPAGGRVSVLSATDEAVGAEAEALRGAELVVVPGPPGIDPHGPADAEVHRFFRRVLALAFDRRPVFFFDDTRLWPMLRFARRLPWPKLDVTSFAHWTGSMLAEPPCPAAPPRTGPMPGDVTEPPAPAPPATTGEAGEADATLRPRADDEGDGKGNP